MTIELVLKGIVRAVITPDRKEISVPNEVLDVSNFLGISEYDVLKDSVGFNVKDLDKIFERYMFNGKISPLARQICRNYLKDVELDDDQDGRTALKKLTKNKPPKDWNYGRILEALLRY